LGVYVRAVFPMKLTVREAFDLVEEALVRGIPIGDRFIHDLHEKADEIVRRFVDRRHARYIRRHRPVVGLKELVDLFRVLNAWHKGPGP
jgi:hypothetical protein